MLKRDLDPLSFANDVLLEVTDKGTIDKLFINSQLLAVCFKDLLDKRLYLKVYSFQGLSWAGDKDAITAHLTNPQHSGLIALNVENTSCRSLGCLDTK